MHGLAELPLLNPTQITGCFVCGVDNPEGLRLRIHRDGTDAVATYTPPATHAGYPERMHGGLIGMLIDEMLVYAGAAHGLWGMTARVGYTLRRAVPLEAPLHLRGTLVRRGGRGFRARVEVRLADGTLAAEGEGTCVLRDGPG